MDGTDFRIPVEQVEHVARLARLELESAEKARMRRELEAILAYVEALRRVDTAGVGPTTHVLPLVNVMRDDEVRPSFPPAAMLANAPEPEGERFRVPKILED